MYVLIASTTICIFPGIADKHDFCFIMRVSKYKLIKRIGIGFAIFIIITAITMVFVTGYIVFHNTSKLVSNDAAYFENSMAYFEERGFDYSGLLETYNVEKVELTSSYDGHTIPAKLIYTNSKNNDTVILIHGLDGNRIEILPFASIFLEHGYNILSYDQRGAGENYAPYTTLGCLESYDTADYVTYLDDMARLNMSGMNIGIPLVFLMFSADIYYQLTLGFSYSKASAEECLKNSTLPVLILATKADKTAPYFMAEKIHAAASDSTLVFVEDSAHGRLSRDYPDWYEEQILLFLKKQSK